ncbi:MAG: hybrid sensor histidine kinase/response regulator [Bacteroidota bacterium]
MEQPTAAQKILVIDDEDAYREIITMTLKIIGYEVFEAMNGLDGLAAAKMHSPDLILCDINMPKMDGHTLLSTLKEEQEFAGIPFIFLTGNTSTADMRKGMQMGADDYLTKPFTAEELVTAVATRLSKKKSMQKYYESQFDDIKSNIVHSLPHEFRTPLNGILGFSQILMDEQDLPQDEVKEIGSMIFRSGQRLHRMLENVVLFGQLQLWMRDETKIAELRSQDNCRLKEVLPVIIEQSMIRHERMGAVTANVVDTCVRITAQRLSKVIEELIDNALKFSASGTAVSVSSELKGNNVIITIRDEGRGMSEEQIGKISGFQQFERGYYEQQGAGLGLAIAKMLVDLHGGTLTINSVENSGTTAQIILPVAS